MAEFMIKLMLMATVVVFVVVPPLATNAAPFLWPKGYIISNTPTLKQHEDVEGTFRVAMDSQGQGIVGRNFALGFLDHNNSGKFTLSIFWAIFLFPQGHQDLEPNRNKPVEEKARLMCTGRADALVLLDSDGTQVWSFGNLVESMELAENGKQHPLSLNCKEKQ